jgi:hypothetical protein
VRYHPRMSIHQHASPCALAGVLLATSMLALAVAERQPAVVPSDAEVQADPLRGLWTRYERRGEGDPLRFWYFHGDGHGLYRYGKVGLANTHSFDYAIVGDTLELKFRKTGERHRIRVEIERDDHGRTWLRMDDDPREPGARYRRVDSELDLEQAAERWATGPLEREAIGDRLWIDYRTYATGGAGFAMYQLARTAIDGRGVGWFHRGDFDEWTTESLTYRVAGDRLELFFDLAEQPNSTGYRVIDAGEGRVLELDVDPRDFWASHRYRDGGKSFGSQAFGPVVGFEVLVAE